MDEATGSIVGKRIQWIVDHLKVQLQKEVPNIARLSILLGIIELYYTDIHYTGEQIPTEASNYSHSRALSFASACKPWCACYYSCSAHWDA